MYLHTPLDRYEYLRIPMDLVPQEFIDAYNLHNKIYIGFLYVEIRKGIYGLPQAGILANKILCVKLQPHVYYKTSSPGIWEHTTCPLGFTLIVNYFVIKYVNKEHIGHLIKCLQETYPIEIDWQDITYCDMNIEWDYEKRWSLIDMPAYMPTQFRKYDFSETWEKRCLYLSPKQRFGKEAQAPDPPDMGDPLLKLDMKYVQRMVGLLLFYGRVPDDTIPKALNSLSQQQSNSTITTTSRVKYLLCYL